MVRFVLLLLMAAASSQALAAVDMDTAAQIYEAAAVREQVRASLGAMPKRIREMFVAEARTPLTDAQLKAITESAERGFRIDVFEPAAIAALAANLDAATAKKTLSFLASDVGLRMVASDKALSALDEPTIDKVMTGDLQAPSTPKRDELFVKLEVAARSTESTVQIFTSMGRAVAIGTAIGTGADPAAVEERSRKAGEASRKDLENGMRDPLRRYMTYGYRDLSDADVKRLLSFLESKPGVRYVSAYTSAMGAGFDAMGKRCGEQLGGALRELAQAQAQNAVRPPPEPQSSPVPPPK
jgi:DNA-binding phage protein